LDIEILVLAISVIPPSRLQVVSSISARLSHNIPAIMGRTASAVNTRLAPFAASLSMVSLRSRVVCSPAVTCRARVRPFDDSRHEKPQARKRRTHLQTIERQDVYKRITAKIIIALEQGAQPWIKPWTLNMPPVGSLGPCVTMASIIPPSTF
jgi:N-terminal domain of anti-restriction factor ArdC